MSYVKREWTVENVWNCSSCQWDNKGRAKKCANCGAPKDDSDAERLPGDVSYGSRVVDPNLSKQFAAGPDWICGYCQHHETKLASVCSECGGGQNEKKDDVRAREMREIIARGKRRAESEKRNRVSISATDRSTISSVKVSDGGGATISASGNSSVSGVSVGTSVFTEVTSDRWWRRLVSRLEVWHGAQGTKTVRIGDAYRETTIDIPGSRPRYLALVEAFGRLTDRIPWARIGRVIASGIVCGALMFLCYYLFATHDANASVTETRWSYVVGLHERRINHGSDWRDSMHAHAFDVMCTRQVRSHHRCDPYSCNPHQVGHDCRCRSVESCHTSCSSGRNGSSRCREVCSSSQRCSTCYSTEYDTCWHSCPDYDDHCEYQYPAWPQVSRATLGGVDHAPIRPALNAVGGQRCPADEEDLNARGLSQCTVDELTFQVQFDAGDTGHWATHPASRREYDRFVTGNRWHVQYNRAGMFRPMENRSNR